MCPIASPMLVAISELFYGPGNFRSGNHPTQQGTWVVSEADCSTISFDQCVALFMRLVDWNRREYVLHLPYSKVANPKFPGYTWVLQWECCHVPQVNRDPPGIVCNGTSSVSAARYIANEACCSDRMYTSTSISSSSTVAQY